MIVTNKQQQRISGFFKDRPTLGSHPVYKTHQEKTVALVEKQQEKPKSKIVKHTNIKKKQVEQIQETVEVAKEINPEAKYQLESGEVVSGKKLRRLYGKAIKQGVFGMLRTRPGYYVKSPGGKYYPIGSEQRFIYERADPDIQQQILSAHSTALIRSGT